LTKDSLIKQILKEKIPSTCEDYVKEIFEIFTAEFDKQNISKV